MKKFRVLIGLLAIFVFQQNIFAMSAFRNFFNLFRQNSNTEIVPQAQMFKVMPEKRRSSSVEDVEKEAVKRSKVGFDEASDEEEFFDAVGADGEELFIQPKVHSQKDADRQVQVDVVELKNELGFDAVKDQKEVQLCYICQDEDTTGPMVNPCKNSEHLVHKNCLKDWVGFHQKELSTLEKQDQLSFDCGVCNTKLSYRDCRRLVRGCK